MKTPRVLAVVATAGLRSCGGVSRSEGELLRDMDRGSMIRASAIEAGASPDGGYRWVNQAGLEREPAGRTKRFVESMTPIQDRPEAAAQREEPGHWEGVLIVDTPNRSAIGTVVDRASRFLLLVHLKADHSAQTVRDGLIATMTLLPPTVRRTLTWDHGAEVSEHPTAPRVPSQPRCTDASSASQATSHVA